VSIFGSIMDKIFHHPAAAQSAGTQGGAGTQEGTGTTGHPPSDMSSSSAASTLIATAEKLASDILSSPSAAPAPTSQTAGTATGTPHNVDVGAVLATMAQEKGGGGDYQHSIVDLLKLLDLDSSLDARKTLAGELGVHAGADGTAEQNIALHKAVTQKLADNGGHVPDSMKG
jgi:hypothetical protein